MAGTCSATPRGAGHSPAAPGVQRNSRFIAPNRLLGPTSCRTMFGLLLVAGAAGWAGGFLDDLSIGFALSRRPKVVELFVISQPQTCAARSPSQMPLRRVSSWPSPPSWRVRWLPSLCWPVSLPRRRETLRPAESSVYFTSVIIRPAYISLPPSSAEQSALIAEFPVISTVLPTTRMQSPDPDMVEFPA